MNTKYKVIKGAIEKDTGKFILPQFSFKDILYRCFDIECNGDVIKINGYEKKTGKKVDTYFRHTKQDCVCKRYNDNTNLTESEIHKEGILNLKYILENNEISKRVIRCCPSCGINLIIDKEIDNLEQNECIKIEYSFKYNGRILRADIAKLTDGKLTQIYEIKHTHTTKEEERPADIEWYEIEAQDINEQINKMTKKDDREIVLNCLRQNQLCPSCLFTKQENERLKREEQERCNIIKEKERRYIQELIRQQKERDEYKRLKEEQKEQEVEQQRRCGIIKVRKEQLQVNTKKYTAEQLQVFKEYDELQAKLKANYDKIGTTITDEERLKGKQRIQQVALDNYNIRNKN